MADIHVKDIMCSRWVLQLLASHQAARQQLLLYLLLPAAELPLAAALLLWPVADMFLPAAARLPWLPWARCISY